MGIASQKHDIQAGSDCQGCQVPLEAEKKTEHAASYVVLLDKECHEQKADSQEEKQANIVEAEDG